ncbi:hypothetical protein JVU11DRAFT_9176 [Chiua virens]|nr:hypothetical protein JVU11DRAFT_9176 [Chiua virens]
MFLLPRGILFEGHGMNIQHVHCAHWKRVWEPIFVCHAHDTIQGRPLSLGEKFAVASKRSRERQEEMAGLPNTVELAIGVEVMVTFNVETSLDVATGLEANSSE